MYKQEKSLYLRYTYNANIRLIYLSAYKMYKYIQNLPIDSLKNKLEGLMSNETKTFDLW